MADILPAPDEPTPAPQPAPVRSSRSTVVCECCGCTLGGDGGIVKTGERARKLARIEDRFDTMQAEIDDLKSRLQKANDRVHEIESELQTKDRKTDVGDY